MADITELKQTDRLIDSWKTINDNFENLNTGKAEASSVYTKSEIDDIANDKVSKSGDTMTGNLNFRRDTTRVQSIDGDNKTISSVILDYYSTGSKNKVTEFYVTKNDNTTTSATLGLIHDFNSDTAYTVAPTPATTDNSTKIATTAFVCNGKANSNNIVGVSLPAFNSNFTSGTLYYYYRNGICYFFLNAVRAKTTSVINLDGILPKTKTGVVSLIEGAATVKGEFYCISNDSNSWKLHLLDTTTSYYGYGSFVIG